MHDVIAELIVVWHAVDGSVCAKPCRGALCWASLLPPRLHGIAEVEFKADVTALIKEETKANT